MSRPTTSLAAHPNSDSAFALQLVIVVSSSSSMTGPGSILERTERASSVCCLLGIERTL
jgi:hypothetical protein